MPPVFPEARWRWTPLFAVSGSLLLALLFFVCIPFTQQFGRMEQPDVIIRQVIRAVPPPRSPPPPPEPAAPDSSPPRPEMTPESPTLDVQPLDIALTAGSGDALAMGVAPSRFEVEHDAVTEIQKVFTFEDLPDAPRLLSAPPYRFPASLRRQGIDSGRVVTKIRILPNGRAELLGIVSSSHQELESVVSGIIARARFTPPEIDGRPQAVVGTFPLQLED